MESEALFQRSAPVVNNFARGDRWDLEFCFMLLAGSASGLDSCFGPISRTGRPGLLTTSRCDDFELIDRSAGRALTPERLAQRPLVCPRGLFYIGVAGSRPRGRRARCPKISTTPHELS